MRRTLFWYVFKDLLKIFFMASGAIAGIMSFGGLLRPLTQNGLGGAEVFRLLSYFMPAMSTYSLPIAALFATTVVYGRMAADNEQTACRACGISFWDMSVPALVLGLFVSCLSMYMLCFTVPNCTFKIERIIVSNVARIIAHSIEQSHETRFNKLTVYAQSAELPEQDPHKPNRQSVVLHGPLIVTTVIPPGKDKYYHVAKEFYTAREAVAYIDEDPEDGTATLSATLTDGVSIPRRFTKSQQAGLATAQFGPVSVPSRLSQKTKFMDIYQLKKLAADPSKGRDVQKVVATFIMEDQSNEECRQLIEQLNSPAKQCILKSGTESYTIYAGGAVLKPTKNGVRLESDAAAKPIIFREISSGQVRLSAETHVLNLTVDADTPNDQFYATIMLKDPLVDAGDTPVPTAEFERKFVVPMPPEAAAMKSRTADLYLNGDVRTDKQLQDLSFAVTDLVNHISAEWCSRIAFVISCLGLVLMGAALGMMFKSGNFLTAFAVSVVPAMFCTVMIVTGQHIAESTPRIITAMNNPLHTGQVVIFGADVIVIVVASVLHWRLNLR